MSSVTPRSTSLWIAESGSPPIVTPRSPAAPQPAALPAALAPEESLLGAKDLKKTYHKGEHAIPVLRGVQFGVAPGEFVAIVGQSGSGKSTLLHLLATLDEPDAGEVYFEGNRVDNLSSAGREILRNKYFGMIFQFYHLLPELTTLENVLLPLMIAHGIFDYWWNQQAYVEKAEHLLELVRMSHRLHHTPKELSGGEMQRAAIARALIAEPQVLLADEPTGNLDSQNGRDVIEILERLNRDQGLTIVMVTHDNGLARRADRTVRLAEGLVESVQ